MSKKKLLATLATIGMWSGIYNSPYSPGCRFKSSCKKNYTNKNANIEYYTDEKGNIRRRKIK